MKKFYALVYAVGMMLMIGSAVACAALPSVLAIVSEITTLAIDATNKLDQVQQLSSDAFKLAPNPAAEAKVSDAIQDCRAGIAAATEAAQGVKDLAQADAAWDKFRAAWKLLEGVLADTGILSTKLAGHRFGGPRLPQPIALRPMQVAK